MALRLELHWRDASTECAKPRKREQERPPRRDVEPAWDDARARQTCAACYPRVPLLTSDYGRRTTSRQELRVAALEALSALARPPAVRAADASLYFAPRVAAEKLDDVLPAAITH